MLNQGVDNRMTKIKVLKIARGMYFWLVKNNYCNKDPDFLKTINEMIRKEQLN